jgi:hypothetical protein
MITILKYHTDNCLNNKNNNVILKNLQENSYNSYENYVRECINYSIIPVVFSIFKLYKNKC